MAGKLVDGDGLIAIKSWVEGNISSAVANCLPKSGATLTTAFTLVGGNGLDVTLQAQGTGMIQLKSGDPLFIQSNNANYGVMLSTEDVTSNNNVFKFPNKSGTFALLSDISAAYIYKGSLTVEQINALTGQVTGDVYNVTDNGTLTQGSVVVNAGDNVAWNGSTWDKLAATIDLSGFLPLSAGASKALTGDLYMGAFDQQGYDNKSNILYFGVNSGDPKIYKYVETIGSSNYKGLFFNSDGNYRFYGDSGDVTFLVDVSSSHTFHFPNQDGTFALASDLATYTQQETLDILTNGVLPA